jgi:hypothetical protein
MFITKSEKQSLVETSLNLGDKVLKLESELNFLKDLMKKSPSWKWVETLEKSLVALEKKHVEHTKYQALRTKNHISRIEFLEGKVRDLNFAIENMACDIMELKLKRPVIVQEISKPKIRFAKRGRPLGSKSVAPKFPPKTPFELKKPLGRPKGSKNKPK